MRREDHVNIFAGCATQNLLDFWLMAMLADAVSRNAFVALWIECIQLRCSSRTGNAALAIDDDVVWLNEPCLQQRRERQNRTRGVAAGISDELGIGNLRFEQF